jgi:hypothetical protein
VIVEINVQRDRLAERAVFSCCSSRVVCITSYHQCAQSVIFEARNSKDVNKFIILSLNMYYGQENCDLPGYYAASSVNFLTTFRDNLSIISSTEFWHLLVTSYRRFGKTYYCYSQLSI